MSMMDWLKNFASPQQLRAVGVLSMNRRNHDFILRCNPRKYFPMVDDKMLTKKLVTALNVPTAPLIGAVQYQYQVKEIMNMVGDCIDGFVIKPGHGSGGRGILVIKSFVDGEARKNDGTLVARDEIFAHTRSILSGLYSLGGKPDYAMLERRIDFSDALSDFSFQGVPDVRIIVYKGFPAMAMIRLATRQSDGRANLHQGAVGVGLRIGDGKPLCAVQCGRPVTTHPDTGRLLTELRVPFWREHLEMAVRCADAIKLGYFGADIVCDKKRGPLILELNARPGLGIQVANGCGLAAILDKISPLSSAGLTPAQRLETIIDLQSV